MSRRNPETVDHPITPPVEPYGRAIGAALAAVAAVGVILLAFSWPTLTAEPRNLPLAITGQPELVHQVGDALAEHSAESVDVTVLQDRAEAVARIEDRTVVGALILDPAHPEVLTASAMGTGPTQFMNRLSAELRPQLTQQAEAAHQPAPQLKITDIVRYTDEDPTGSRLTASALPLVIGGILGGALLSSLVSSRGHQLVGLGCYAVAGGFGLAAILHFWYGALPGHYPTFAAVITLTLLAIASIVIALRRLLGPLGIGIGAVLFVLLGNAISGVNVPSEFLPGPWGDIGLAMPQGAAASLLRQLAYFPDAGTGTSWSVLGCWAAAGLLLIMITPKRHPQPGHESDGTSRRRRTSAGDETDGHGHDRHQEVSDGDHRVPSMPS